jgi:predicted dinucleotide-binding enzyme
LGKKNIVYCKDIADAISDSEVILIAVPWNEFADLDPSVFKKNQVVVDPWRLFKGKRILAQYIPLGVSRQAK